jgi:hypothetical protein
MADKIRLGFVGANVRSAHEPTPSIPGHLSAAHRPPVAWGCADVLCCSPQPFCGQVDAWRTR